MIFSKQNLKLTELTKADKAIPALNNIHLCKDGTTVATNGLTIIAVSPVTERVLNNVILDNSKMRFDATITTESIKEVIKNIPRDTKFHGILEHVNYKNGSFELHDGKRKKVIEAKEYSRDYIKYHQDFANAFQSQSEKKIVVNLKRLQLALKVLNDLCGDSSGNTPLFIQFTKGKDVILRCQNRKTSQQVLSIFKSYDGIEGKWPPLSQWERKFIGVTDTIKKKLTKIKKIIKSSN